MSTRDVFPYRPLAEDAHNTSWRTQSTLLSPPGGAKSTLAISSANQKAAPWRRRWLAMHSGGLRPFAGGGTLTACWLHPGNLERCSDKDGARLSQHTPRPETSRGLWDARISRSGRVVFITFITRANRFYRLGIYIFLPRPLGMGTTFYTCMHIDLRLVVWIHELKTIRPLIALIIVCSTSSLLPSVLNKNFNIYLSIKLKNYDNVLWMLQSVLSVTRPISILSWCIIIIITNLLLSCTLFIVLCVILTVIIIIILLYFHYSFG